MIKSVRHRLEPSDPFWVGDGFPVRNFFSYDNPALIQELSPFLHLDHGGPVRFEPTEKRRGVGEHPHRGFETVTIVYEGEVEHRDSSGGGGKIGPGDVQWMTAGSGVVHEEFHGREFAKKGGSFEMIQLWVNLPRAEKMTQPRYQGLGVRDINLLDVVLESNHAPVIATECCLHIVLEEVADCVHRLEAVVLIDPAGRL
jgi:redox-sensitive bicupin YhaK (pirin superfamily)